MVLPPGAPYRAPVEVYLAGLDRVLPGEAVAGAYLIGSAALGDYQPGRSDLDLVILTARTLEGAELAALARLHEELETGAQPHADATYMPAELLGGLRLLRALGQAYVADGVFRLGTARQDPVTWAMLAQCGITLRGPAARFLGVAPDPFRLAEWIHRDLEGYWRRMAIEARRMTASLDGAVPVSPEQMVFAATGPGRLYWTIATGEIISKTRSADFTAEVFSNYAELLGRAKASRLGDESVTFTVDDARAVADLVDEVCDAAKRLL